MLKHWDNSHESKVAWSTEAPDPRGVAAGHERNGEWAKRAELLRGDGVFGKDEPLLSKF